MQTAAIWLKRRRPARKTPPSLTHFDASQRFQRSSMRFWAASRWHQHRRSDEYAEQQSISSARQHRAHIAAEVTCVDHGGKTLPMSSHPLDEHENHTHAALPRRLLCVLLPVTKACGTLHGIHGVPLRRSCVGQLSLVQSEVTMPPLLRLRRPCLNRPTWRGSGFDMRLVSQMNSALSPTDRMASEGLCVPDTTPAGSEVGKDQDDGRLRSHKDAFPARPIHPPRPRAGWP
jgi:hypothetical protein